MTQHGLKAGAFQIAAGLMLSIHRFFAHSLHDLNFFQPITGQAILNGSHLPVSAVRSFSEQIIP